MHVGKSQAVYAYYMNSQQLEKVTQEKDLDILISNDLKVSQQCQAATMIYCSKATRILGIINRTIVFRHPDSDILISPGSVTDTDTEYRTEFLYYVVG